MMKIKQTKTAIESFHSLTEAQLSREENDTIKHLVDYPKTISMLCRITGIEKSSMSRVLNSLYHKKSKVDIVKIDKCPITNKKVQWYRIKETQLQLDLEK
jgi:hypothetical protein